MFLQPVEVIGYQMESPPCSLLCSWKQNTSREPKSHMYKLVQIVHLTLGIPSPPSKAEGDHAHLRFVWALEYRNLVFTPSCQELCALSLVPSHVLISVLSCICTPSMKKDCIQPGTYKDHGIKHTSKKENSRSKHRLEGVQQLARLLCYIVFTAFIIQIYMLQKNTCKHVRKLYLCIFKNDCLPMYGSLNNFIHVCIFCLTISNCSKAV